MKGDFIKMESTTKNRGGRKGIFRSHEAWTEAGKPNGYEFDHQAGSGRIKSAEERRLDELTAKRHEMKNRRSPKYRRERLRDKLEELARR
jgi:hypothetical protein